jgi:hypothetical protein
MPAARKILLLGAAPSVGWLSAFLEKAFVGVEIAARPEIVVVQDLPTREVLAATRGEKAFQVLDQLAGAMNLLPTSALVAAARHQAETVDFTTSNLRGAPFPLFFGGAQIVENYPVGPLAGTAFNLTVLSYAGELHLGLLADSAAIADPEALRDALADAFEELTT